MATKEARNRATKKHHEKLDDIKVRRPKGERDIVAAHAATKGTSMNDYINTLIDKDMEQTAQAKGMTLEEYRDFLKEEHKKTERKKTNPTPTA